ncbi:MAG: YeaC family protein [Gammaproteobacteria bacterium]|nr:YeaC family protein [Gammaproteobacteria bacterium]
MTDFIKMIDDINPETYASLRQSLELGKWPDGTRLSREQKELTMMAIIAWEQKNLPEEQRTGYLGGDQCASKSNQASVDTSLFAPAAGTIH